MKETFVHFNLYNTSDAWASDNYCPKTLFTGVFALYTVFIVAHSVLIVEEVAVFLFFLLT